MPLDGSVLGMPVASGLPAGNPTIPAYRAVINNIGAMADDILAVLNAADDTTDISAVVQSLHNLVQYSRLYGLTDCVRFAGSRGEVGVVDSIFRHPLLRIILLYVSTYGPSDGVYIDWRIEVYETKSLFRRKSRRLAFQIDYNLTMVNPYNDKTIR